MSTILELNDAALTVHQGPNIAYCAPAIALVEDRSVVFGAAALRRARIQPRQTNPNYLGRLNADPLPLASRIARNHADLVYLHLKDIAPLTRGAVLVAAPGIYSADQLGVLLGILQETGIQVQGFVDSAIAAAAAHPLAGPTWHLDVLLQRAVLTRLDVSATVARVEVLEVPECGLLRLLDTWANAVAGDFIRETRFDPQHAAPTEQQLYDQVFASIETLSPKQESLPFEIEQSGQTRRVELKRSELETRGAQRFQTLVERLPRGIDLLLSPRAQRLPGLHAACARARVNPVALAEDALRRGCAAHLGFITAGDELRLVTELPAQRAAPSALAIDRVETPRAPARQAPSHDDQRPTHLLLGHRALPLGHVDCPVEVQQHGPITLLRAAVGVTLNGAPVVRDTSIEPGDVIDHP
ncbi:MAG: hypothetical protein ACKOBM_11070, partial [Gammaproteobacteria bacterium]